MNEMKDRGVIRCEEVRELMGQMSCLIPKIGILALLFIAVATLAVAAFVDCPKIVNVDMSLRNAQEVMAVYASSSGRMSYICNSTFVNKGDTLAVIKTNNNGNSYLVSPMNGRLFFCGTQQVGNYIEKGECMFALADTVESQIVGKALVTKEVRDRICEGMRAECSIGGKVLVGQMSGMAQCANPVSGLYSIVATFPKTSQTPKELVWNDKVSVKIVSSPRCFLEEILLH